MPATRPTDRFLLDAFTLDNLNQWRAASKALDEYHLRFYYELEGQRKTHQGDLIRALEPAVLNSIEFQKWIRICTWTFSYNPYSSIGSTTQVGGRFNIGEMIDAVGDSPFPALYIAEDRDTAYREKFGVTPRKSSAELSPLDFAVIPRVSTTSVFFHGVIHNVIDITKQSNLAEFCKIIAKFKMSPGVLRLAKKAQQAPMELIKDPKKLIASFHQIEWRAWGTQLGIPSNSQVFGRFVYEGSYSGILYRSVRGKGRCLALFPENLVQGDSSLSLVDNPPASTIPKSITGEQWRISFEGS